MEKRFDVRVPLVNTTLLEQLAAESEKTGIVESRLIVLYATKYVEMSRAGHPMMVQGIAVPPSMAVNGHGEVRAPEPQPIQSQLSSESLNTLFGDPD